MHTMPQRGVMSEDMAADAKNGSRLLAMQEPLNRCFEPDEIGTVVDAFHDDLAYGVMIPEAFSTLMLMIRSHEMLREENARLKKQLADIGIRG